MVSVALKVSEEFKAKIAQLPWVNWSELAREEVLKQKEKLKLFEEAERIVSKSKLTEAQAEALANEVSISLARRYERLLKKRS